MHSVVVGVEVVRGMELVEDLHIPIVLKAHEIPQPHLLASINDFVEDWILEICHVVPINPLHLNDLDVFGMAKNRAIEVLVELAVEPWIKSIILSI